MSQQEIQRELDNINTALSQVNVIEYLLRRREELLRQLSDINHAKTKQDKINTLNQLLQHRQDNPDCRQRVITKINQLKAELYGE